MGNVKLFFDVIMRLSEALVFFRTSGDDFLRSITRAIVNKFWNHFEIILGSFWEHFGIILGSFLYYFGIMLGSFPKQCLHYGVLAFSRAGKGERPAQVPGHAKLLKQPSVLSFYKKMVLALEFWTPPFHFLMNASANLFVFLAKLIVTPRLGLQRHLAS